MEYKKIVLFNYIVEMLSFDSIKLILNEEFKESRFSKGEVCPHCQSTSIVKSSKLNGKQRYIYKSCKKTFNNLTKSTLSCTKLPLEKMQKMLVYVLKHHSICDIKYLIA